MSKWIIALLLGGFGWYQYKQRTGIEIIVENEAAKRIKFNINFRGQSMTRWYSASEGTKAIAWNVVDPLDNETLVILKAYPETANENIVEIGLGILANGAFQIIEPLAIVDFSA